MHEIRKLKNCFGTTGKLLAWFELFKEIPKKRGLAKTEHKPPIADEDFKRLYESGVFNTDSLTTLQNKVFFEIMFFFCQSFRLNIPTTRFEQQQLRSSTEMAM